MASLRVTRDEYHAEAIKTGNPNTWSVYRKLRNHVTKLARKSKTNFFKSAIQNSKGDSKTMWSHVNKLFPKTKSSGISSLKIDGRLITTPKDRANKFNTFFVSIGDNLANLFAVPSRTAPDWLRSSCEAVGDQFHSTPVTALEVQKSLEALNSQKATCFDDIQAKLLKIAAPAISESLCFLLNFSLTSGKVPSDWKKAQISAIFKKGSKLDPGNYRPISVLPVISKLLERIVHTQLYTYLNDTGLLAAEQSGFRKNHSTQTSLHKLLENFYSDIENGKIIGMLALDLRKAFDTVNHKILLDKLKHYGISGISLNWFRSYLESRTQMACINGSVSDRLIITTGVPQGSFLGPLLFYYLHERLTQMFTALQDKHVCR